jgi:hypothetical protein
LILSVLSKAFKLSFNALAPGLGPVVPLVARSHVLLDLTAEPPSRRAAEPPSAERRAADAVAGL